MTNNTSPSPYIAAEQIGQSTAYIMFDGSTSTYWQVSYPALPYWTGKIYLGTAKRCYSYGIQTAGVRLPSGWQFQGSNDGSNWTTLDTQTGLSLNYNSYYEYTCPSVGIAYSYYRMNITSVAGDSIAIAEIYIFQPLAAQVTGIFTSSNSGVTWTERNIDGLGTAFDWRCVASDNDGSVLMAGAYGKRLWMSVNSGVAWTEQRPGGVDANKNWSSCASDSDGSNLIACAYGNRLYTYASATWTERQPAGNVDANWQCVASSTDGTVLYAGVYGGRLYKSVDSGAHWTEVQPAGAVNANWQYVSCDNTGNRVIVCAYGGQVYTSLNGGLS